MSSAVILVPRWNTPDGLIPLITAKLLVVVDRVEDPSEVPLAEVDPSPHVEARVLDTGQKLVHAPDSELGV